VYCSAVSIFELDVGASDSLAEVPRVLNPGVYLFFFFFPVFSALAHFLQMSAFLAVQRIWNDTVAACSRAASYAGDTWSSVCHYPNSQQVEYAAGSCVIEQLAITAPTSSSLRLVLNVTDRFAGSSGISQSADMASN
jgi:hypothetical protein